MRTSLSPTPTQVWMSVGLDRWQQSIARREASRIAKQTKGVVLQWVVRESEYLMELKEWISLPSLVGRPRFEGDSRVWQSTSPESSQSAKPSKIPNVLLISRSAVEQVITGPATAVAGSATAITGAATDRVVFGDAILGGDCGAAYEDVPPLRLIWDWGASGKLSLDWATSLGFAGVIFDFSTLRSWARVAAERLPCTLKELHPLVASLPPNLTFKPQKS